MARLIRDSHLVSRSALVKSVILQRLVLKNGIRAALRVNAIYFAFFARVRLADRPRPNLDRGSRRGIILRGRYRPIRNMARLPGIGAGEDVCRLPSGEGAVRAREWQGR